MPEPGFNDGIAIGGTVGAVDQRILDRPIQLISL
jgi:hypothetical protein